MAKGGAAVSRTPARNWTGTGALILVFVVLILLPVVYTNDYLFHLMILTSISVVLASGLNISTGYTNQVSLAQGAFYGVGSYTSTLAAINLGLPFWLALPLAALVTGLFGFLLAVPSLRVRGHYLAITTLGFQQVINLTMANWYDVTKGAFGIQGIPGVTDLGPITFQSLPPYYYLYCGIAALGVYLVYRLVHSTVGLELLAVRDEEQAAGAMGINVSRTRILALTLSAVYAGVAGSMLAHYQHSIDPSEFNIWSSVLVLAMVLIGGRGTVLGPVVGAFVLTLAPEYLRVLQDYRLIVYGLMMMVVVIFLPNGLVGVFNRSRRAPKATPAAKKPDVDVSNVPARK